MHLVTAITNLEISYPLWVLNPSKPW
jgi:hypothetical protein